MGYITAPVEADADEIAEAVLDYIAANVPGWTPQEGNLEVIMVEGFAARAAEAIQTAGLVPDEIFRFFGRSLIGLAPVEAAPARTLVQWDAADDQGYTIPSGTVVAYPVAGDQSVLFYLPADLIIAPGASSAIAEVIATQAGTAGNGLPPGPMTMVVPLASIAAVSSTVDSSGGAEAESSSSYLDRLSDELTLLSPRPILADDFAKLARRVPGVFRALAVDNYNPDDETDDNERMVAVAMIDAEGQGVSEGVQDAVVAMLEAKRETNFIVNAMDPTYTTVNVVYVGHALAGFDTAAVQSAVAEALAGYLNPATWAAQDGTQDWRPVRIVRYLEVATLINNVPGFDYLTTLTLNGGTVNVNLAGPAPLPELGTVGATVV